MSKVNKTENGCWEWTGHVTQQGYGSFSVNSKPVAAHRMSYVLFNGVIPDGNVVRHSCHNTRCVNPAHLVVGTQADNAKDRILSGRGNVARGDQHWTRRRPEWRKHSKIPHKPHVALTPEIVLDVRDLFKSGTNTKSDIARKHGIAISTVCGILSGRFWTWCKTKDSVPPRGKGFWNPKT